MLLSICLICFVFSGCTTTYTHNTSSKTYTITPEHIPGFKVKGDFKLINAVPEGNVIRLGELGITKWNGDLKLWTDSAIEYVTGLLGSSNVNSTGNKSLKLAIKDVKLDYTMIGKFCVLTLDVETGNGYKNSYTVEHHVNLASMGGVVAGMAAIPRSMDGAVYKSIIAMFNDKQILDYIEK